MNPWIAISAFDLRSPDGGVPVVLVPKDHGFPFQLFVQIPSGVFVLYQNWHKHAGLRNGLFKYIWLFIKKTVKLTMISGIDFVLGGMESVIVFGEGNKPMVD